MIALLSDCAQRSSVACISAPFASGTKCCHCVFLPPTRMLTNRTRRLEAVYYAAKIPSGRLIDLFSAFETSPRVETFHASSFSRVSSYCDAIRRALEHLRTCREAKVRLFDTRSAHLSACVCVMYVCVLCISTTVKTVYLATEMPFGGALRTWP